MRLGVSSAAAPDASFHELVEICARRGLTSLELREADAHGVSGAPTGIGGAQAQEHARSHGVGISAIRSSVGGEDLALARVALSARASVIVEGGCCVSSRLDRADGLSSVGAEVAIAVDGSISGEELTRITSRGFGVAWDAELSTGDLGRIGARMLDALESRLAHIRVLGGGPEAAMQEGRGVGELMGRLALASYAGTVILAPSTPRYRVAWERWLGRRGGWGCGSKEQDASLVNLELTGDLAGTR